MAASLQMRGASFAHRAAERQSYGHVIAGLDPAIHQSS
jgi:hypothetical protein